MTRTHHQRMGRQPYKGSNWFWQIFITDKVAQPICNTKKEQKKLLFKTRTLKWVHVEAIFFTLFILCLELKSSKVVKSTVLLEVLL